MMLWLIYNRTSNLFWNQDDGWGHVDTATRFTEQQHQSLLLPMEGEWVREDSHEAQDWKDPDA